MIFSYRITFLTLLFLGVCSYAQNQPNVIVILTDDQGYGDMACHGNPYIQTPNIDKLYKESLRLTDFHVDAMCAPTRAALMTGKYSARTGVWATIHGRNILHKDEKTMADYFKESGYNTAMYGKWHLGDAWPYRPIDRGFNESFHHAGGVIGETPDYWNNHYFEGRYIKNSHLSPVTTEYCTDLWFNKALDFIEQQSDKPFFIYLALNAPHGPYDVDTKYYKHYLEVGLPESTARQYGLIEKIDENLGRFRQQLNALGVDKNTLIVFMGDNGATAGQKIYNAGMRDRKAQTYNGAHRTFCFISWPEGNLETNIDIKALAAHIDLIPTFKELCDLKTPLAKDLDGISLAKFILNPQIKGDPKRVIVTHNQQLYTPKKYKDFEVLTPTFRLSKSSTRDTTLTLTNILKDPRQKKNIIADHPKVKDMLLKYYEQWWEHISDRFNELCPNYLSKKTDPLLLTAHSWHDNKNKTYNQSHIRAGVIDNGFWPLEVLDDGYYIISLRRWPKELNLPIRAGTPALENIPHVSKKNEGVAVKITSAQLRINNTSALKKVKKRSAEIPFKIYLPKGRHELKTVFTDQSEIERGAYYVYISPANK